MSVPLGPDALVLDPLVDEPLVDEPLVLDPLVDIGSVILLGSVRGCPGSSN
jgi:hypothetical protein